MIYKFHACGHPNILATHKTTLEFTKDENLSLKGDCIIGVKADFELGELKKFIRNSRNRKIRIILEAGRFREEINAELNPHFNSEHEMVIRKTDFASERTFAVKADKAGFELRRGLARYLRDNGSRINIIIKITTLK